MINEDKKNEFSSIASLFVNMQTKTKKKAPTYQWQELALQIINDLNIPANKRSSVFKACKEKSPEFIKRCLTDTKELCNKGEDWRYFFKLINLK